ncbi:hypothetical protein [Paracoccus thiocyanatus]|uniref:Nickel/cobalt transporter regulator n=1 Tax=Paracoccus thiocyanatus TaxID=34006 RepID=A0A3D8PBK3_9RHOB|nr:hypothetical protein [Paracoccus thiocyanatus]RDW12549.1 hypothetical protein DIE28_13090 [Paracoccus thiocyanatus]
MLRDRPSLFVAAGFLAALATACIGQQAGRADQAAAPADRPAVLRVGDRLEEVRLHMVTRPGLYGMSQAPDGSRYGIVDGKLIRYDPESAQVLSIIRQVDRIVD